MIKDCKVQARQHPRPSKTLRTIGQGKLIVPARARGCSHCVSEGPGMHDLIGHCHSVGYMGLCQQAMFSGENCGLFKAETCKRSTIANRWGRVLQRHAHLC